MIAKACRFSRAVILVAICILLIARCKSAQLSGQAIEGCLTRTDFTGMNSGNRASIAWLIAYEGKVRGTTCCAIEPRSSILKKHGNTSELKNEILSRIDILEAGGDAEARANLRRNNNCYAALMDLYHDVNFAQRR